MKLKMCDFKKQVKLVHAASAGHLLSHQTSVKGPLNNHLTQEEYPLHSLTQILTYLWRPCNRQRGGQVS